MIKKLPSWIKTNGEGGLRVNTADPEWQMLFIEQVKQFQKSKLNKDLKKYGTVIFPD